MPPLEQPDLAAARFRTELDRNFRLPLIAYFLKRVGNRAEAEDMTQEVFLRVLRQGDAIDIERAKSYVFTAAANLLRDRARLSAIRKTETRADFGDPADAVIPQLIEEISPERVLAGRQTLKSVLTALDGLSQRTRDIFVLYRIEKMKQHEIAGLYGLSHSAVEKHLAKAVAYLTERFERP